VMDSGWLIVCGVVTFVILVNVGLALSALRAQRGQQASTLDRVMRYIRNPWAAEDQALSELRRSVATLEENPDPVKENES
jgi:hypothetical protein